MKRIIQKPQVLAAIMASLGPVAVQAGFLQNPSFESNYNDAFPHYGSIDNWTGGSGVNEGAGPFHNSGTTIPDQARVAFIQGADKTLSQDVTGLVVGKKYWVQFYYDARGCCGGTIDVATKFNGVQIDNVVNVKPAGNPAQYYFRNVEFTAEADSGTLAFVTAGSGDATLNLDAVSIVQRDAGNVVLQNPSFEASGEVADTGAVSALAGWGITGTVGISSAVNGAVPDQDHVAFLQGASSLSQRVSSLIVGKPYTLTVAYNARTGTKPHLQIKVGANIAFEEDVSPVGNAAAYKTKTVTFTATDITADITITQSKAGSDVLLVDNLRLVGDTGKELGPVALAPASAELGVGEQQDFTLTVPAELLATKPADILLQSSATSVLRFVDASGALLSRTSVHFDKGGAAAKPVKVQVISRGSAIVQVIDAAGLKVANQPAVVVVSSALKNPSFESTPVPSGVGYGTIAGWIGGSGLNSPPGPFSDNGIVPDRNQVAFQQGAGTLAQTVRGLTPGKNYWLQFFYNVRNGSTMDVSVRLAGAELTKLAAVTPVGAGVPYYFQHLEFTASAATELLEFVTTPTGDSTFLLDAVTVVQRDPGQIVVRNPSFEASGSVYPFPGYFNSVAGWTVGGGGRGVNIDGAGPFTDNGRAGDQDLVLFMQGNGSFVSQTLTGLTSGKKYLVGFLVNARRGGPEDSVYSANIDDAPILEESIQPVGGANRYYVRQASFTAAAAEAELKFLGSTPAGDHTILLDNVVVLPDAGSKPYLLAQPTAASVAVNGSVSFSVAAVGSGTLTYQWKKNGQVVSGQTGDTLNLDNLAAADAGDYTVEVKNSTGTTSSGAAHLNVLEAITGTFDTGVDNSRVPLADGATDNHYTLVKNADAATSTKAFVEDGSKWPIVAGPWLANSDLSKWIGPRTDPGMESPLSGPAGGDYVYRLNLDLTGFDPNTVVLSGGWASDNSAELLVNGLLTGLTEAGFATLANFNVNGVFKAGVNQIDFKVNNGDATGGPTGLRVEGLTALGVRAAATIPVLAIARSGDQVKIAWLAPATGFALESAATLAGPWIKVGTSPTTDGGKLNVTQSAGGGVQFYRLKK